MKSGAWTSEEDETLITLLLETNDPLNIISIYLDRSHTSVFKRVRIVLKNASKYYNLNHKNQKARSQIVNKFNRNKPSAGIKLKTAKKRAPGTPVGPRGGFREHLGFTVRSSWENNVILWLKHRRIKFEYEPKAFVFPETRGAKSFLPDLYLPGKDIWIEVKGHFRSTDRTKMRRLKQYYPEIFERMQFIVEKRGCPADVYYKKIGLKPYAYYNEISQEFKDKLSFWESKDNNYGRE